MVSWDAFQSHIIRWWTKSKYSHVSLFLGPKVLWDVDWSGTEVVSHLKYLRCPRSIYRPKEVSPEQLNQVTTYCVAHIGDPHPLLSFGRGDWCTDAVYNSYLFAGIKLFERPKDRLIYPSDFEGKESLEKMLEVKKV